MDIPYQDINSKTVDRWVDEGWEWGRPISHEEYEKATAGTWDVKLTPVKFVPHRKEIDPSIALRMRISMYIL